MLKIALNKILSYYQTHEQWEPRRQSLNFLVNDCSSLSPINNQFFMLTCSKLLGPKFPIKMTRENWPNRMLWTITTGNFRNTIFWAGRYRNSKKKIQLLCFLKHQKEPSECRKMKGGIKVYWLSGKSCGHFVFSGDL